MDRWFNRIKNGDDFKIIIYTVLKFQKSAPVSKKEACAMLTHFCLCSTHTQMEVKKKQGKR